MEKNQTLNVEPGCYVDGHWGQYGTRRLCEIVDTMLGTRYLTVYDREDHDGKIEVADEAEEALRKVLPEGLTCGWIDGEFFVQTVEWFEEA